MKASTSDAYRGVTISDKWTETSSSGISVAISPMKVRAKTDLADVMRYDNADVVNRIKKDLRLDDQAASELWMDLKRFLWLAAVSPPTSVPAPKIDEAWHCFVLYTRDYAEFCAKYFNGFLHHAPLRLKGRRLQPFGLRKTIDAMHAEFGGLPSENWHYTGNHLAVA